MGGSELRLLFFIGLICFVSQLAPNAQAQMVCTNDPDGIEGGSQSDITQICYDISADEMSFSWDPTSIWNGGNTGDNCVFYDTDSDGNADEAFCISIESSTTGAQIAAGYPATFICTDKKPDRCTNPVGPTAATLSTCTLSISPSDPFGGADAPDDLKVDCQLDAGDFVSASGAPYLSCAFNSANPNSSPSDCIIYDGTAAPAATIAKSSSASTYTSFGESIPYSYDVVNTGNTVFTSLAVTDDKIAAVTCPALISGILPPGQTVTCSGTYTIQGADLISGSVTNIAFATLDGPLLTATDTVTITYNAPVPGPLTASKSVAPFDPLGGNFTIPGEDVIYTISVTNTGAVASDTGTIFLVDELPSDIEFFNGDIDTGGPDTFTGTDPIGFNPNGTGVTFNYATDIAYSNGLTRPTIVADCNYTPAAGYDAAVKFICFNPQGSLGFGDPDPSVSFSFRSRVK